MGGAGIVFAAPAAALLTAPGQAQAAPLCVPPTASCGSGGSVVVPLIVPGVPSGPSLFGAAFTLADPFLSIAGQVPIMNAFIGIGAAGTALHPDGGNAGLFLATVGPDSARPRLA